MVRADPTMIQVVKKKKKKLRDMKLESDETEQGRGKSLAAGREQIQGGNTEHLNRCLMFGVEARCGHLPLHLADLTPVTSAPRVSLPNQQGI